jgi:hypothetical protein
MIPDFTILVALDREHLQEFAWSYPTWIMHKPNLIRRPLLLAIDVAHHDDRDDAIRRWTEALQFVLRRHCGPVSFFEWDGLPELPQRERMLTALVRAVADVETPYYLKIDTDTIATGGPDNWINPEWFDGSPACIASPWGYTKPAGMVADFDLWADKHPQAFGALRIEHKIMGNVARHRRMISWLMFGNTAWSRRMAGLAGERLPIPSQDTFLSCCAARGGGEIRRVRMSEHGWRHVGGGGKRLQVIAREALA